MNSLEIDLDDVRPVSAVCIDDMLVVRLSDGRALSSPLAWYPRLAAATPAERADVVLSPLGLHWPKIDEDLSLAGLFRGERGR